MKPVYAVKILKDGKDIGYHSVWASLKDAERVSRIHNEANGSDYWQYFVKEITEYTMGQNWYNKNFVKMADSVGTLPVYS